MMGLEDVFALMPLLLTSGGAVAIMLVVAFVPRHGLAAGLGLLMLALSLFATMIMAPSTRPVAGLLLLDGRTQFFWSTLLLAALAIAVLSQAYLRPRRVHGENHHREFYILLLLGVCGALTASASWHFAAFFIGLELLSLSLFGLLAYFADSRRALEAGMKYLVLSGLSSAVLLFGIALLYAASGSLTLEDVRLHTADPMVTYAMAGMALVVAGVGFKLSLVPFHMWTPDVYEGASAPVSAFIATVSKIAVAAWLLRFLEASGAWSMPAFSLAFGVLVTASMLAGNVLALAQENVKRILAYSSIAHMGYLTLPLVAGGPFAAESVMFYAAGYAATLLAAFGVISVLSENTPGEEVVHISAYRGLFWRRPVVAAVFAVALLSLAGIPVSVGFMAKFYIFAAGVDAALWLPLLMLVASSAIGLYFYLRVLSSLFLASHGPAAYRPMKPAGALLVGLLAFILVVGAAPSPLVEAVRVFANLP